MTQNSGSSWYVVVALGDIVLFAELELVRVAEDVAEDVAESVCEVVDVLVAVLVTVKVDDPVDVGVDEEVVDDVVVPDDDAVPELDAVADFVPDDEAVDDEVDVAVFVTVVVELRVSVTDGLPLALVVNVPDTDDVVVFETLTELVPVLDPTLDELVRGDDDTVPDVEADRDTLAQLDEESETVVVGDAVAVVVKELDTDTLPDVDLLVNADADTAADRDIDTVVDGVVDKDDDAVVDELTDAEPHSDDRGDAVIVVATDAERTLLTLGDAEKLGDFELCELALAERLAETQAVADTLVDGVLLSSADFVAMPLCVKDGTVEALIDVDEVTDDDDVLEKLGVTDTDTLGELDTVPLELPDGVALSDMALEKDGPAEADDVDRAVGIFVTTVELETRIEGELEMHAVVDTDTNPVGERDRLATFDADDKPDPDFTTEALGVTVGVVETLGDGEKLPVIDAVTLADVEFDARVEGDAVLLVDGQGEDEPVLAIVRLADEELLKDGLTLELRVPLIVLEMNELVLGDADTVVDSDDIDDALDDGVTLIDGAGERDIESDPLLVGLVDELGVTRVDAVHTGDALGDPDELLQLLDFALVLGVYVEPTDAVSAAPVPDTLTDGVADVAEDTLGDALSDPPPTPRADAETDPESRGDAEPVRDGTLEGVPADEPDRDPVRVTTGDADRAAEKDAVPDALPATRTSPSAPPNDLSAGPMASVSGCRTSLLKKADADRGVAASSTAVATNATGSTENSDTSYSHAPVPVDCTKETPQEAPEPDAFRRKIRGATAPPVRSTRTDDAPAQTGDVAADAAGSRIDNSKKKSARVPPRGIEMEPELYIAPEPARTHGEWGGHGNATSRRLCSPPPSRRRVGVSSLAREPVWSSHYTATTLTLGKVSGRLALPVALEWQPTIASKRSYC